MSAFSQSMQKVVHLFNNEENAAMESLIPEIMEMEPVKVNDHLSP